MDNSVQPLSIENGTDPFEQSAALVRQGLDGLRSLYDQQSSEGEHLLQDLNGLQTGIEQLESDLAAATTEREQIQADLVAIRHEKDRLKVDLQTAHAQLDQLSESEIPEPSPPEAPEDPVTCKPEKDLPGEAETDDELHPETRRKRENKRLKAENSRLEEEVECLQQRLAELSAEVQPLREERVQLQRTLEETEARLATLQTESEAAGQQLKAREKELETKRKEISGLNRSLNRSKKTLNRTREDLDIEQAINLDLREELDTERATNQELRQDLDSATQAEQAIQRDLEICKSARDQLAKQVEDLQQAVRKEREQSGWEVVTRLTAVLTKLSALANQEPDQVLGLSERAVFEEFRSELGRAAGGRLEPFPRKKEIVDNLLWLDADQNGLEALQARYDWSPERPFEGLSPGDRRIPFRLSRRGWSVSDRVLQRAHIVPVALEQEPTPDSQPEELSAASEPQPGEPDADQSQS